MKKIFNSLYGKITLIFMVLMLVLGGIQIYLAMDLSTSFVQETEQKLNADLAENMYGMFKGYLQDSIDAEGIRNSFEQMMMMNPRVEYYLLESDGTIITHAAPPGKVQVRQVALEPIERYRANKTEGRNAYPILGDDPRNPASRKPISVAAIDLPGGRKGYLYVNLSSEKYISATELAGGSYTRSLMVLSLAGAVLVALLVGLLIFATLSRRFRRISEGVQAFQSGDYGRRIRVESNDEVGMLATTFNSMAATIEGNIVELKDNDRMRRDLVANVSHDLRTPLASIQGYLETIMMKNETLSAAERVHFLDTVLGNVSTLNKLVGELFELSKLDARQNQPQREAFSLLELAQDVALKLQPAAEKKGIRLQVHFDQDVPFVYADIAMIERAMTNLLENAIRYTEAQGRVALELRKNGKRVDVRIHDTGIGIPPEELPHIFDRFYRVEKSRSRSGGGTGLGLAITKKILEVHDSEISVHSAPEQGTTFRFDLAAS